MLIHTFSFVPATSRRNRCEDYVGTSPQPFCIDHLGCRGPLRGHPMTTVGLTKDKKGIYMTKGNPHHTSVSVH